MTIGLVWELKVEELMMEIWLNSTTYFLIERIINSIFHDLTTILCSQLRMQSPADNQRCVISVKETKAWKAVSWNIKNDWSRAERSFCLNIAMKSKNVTGFIPHMSTHPIHPSSAYPYQSRGGAGVGAYPSYHRSDGNLSFFCSNCF